MTQSARTTTSRERLRWQRATDERLIDAIYGRVIRDVPLPTPAAPLGNAVAAVPAPRV